MLLVSSSINVSHKSSTASRPPTLRRRKHAQPIAIRRGRNHRTRRIPAIVRLILHVIVISHSDSLARSLPFSITALTFTATPPHTLTALSSTINNQRVFVIERVTILAVRLTRLVMITIPHDISIVTAVCIPT